MPEISTEQRDATLANLRAMNAEMEAEAQLRRDAEMWRAFVAKAPLAAQLVTDWLPKEQ